MKLISFILFLVPFSIMAQECLDSPCTIKFSESLKLKSGDTIFFEKVLEDSRCPSSVQCRSAGQVRIQVKVNDKELELKLPGKESFSVNDTKYELHSVDPHPKTSSNNYKKYSIQFFSKKNNEN